MAAIIFCIFFSFSSCPSDSSDSFKNSGNSSEDSSSTTLQTKFILDYKFGSYPIDPNNPENSPNNIYVIWAENPNESFYQPIIICERLVEGVKGKPLNGTPLPYWNVRYFKADAVTQSTKRKRGLSETFSLSDSAPTEFTIYFETDIPGNGNDWFNDQPAILYECKIDRSDLRSEYELDFIGWTPDDYCLSSAHVSLEEGELRKEMGYITNFKDPLSTDILDVFGEGDSRAQTTALVKSIAVRPVPD